MNKQVVSPSTWLPLEQLSEAVTNSGILKKKLAVVFVPNEELVIPDSPKPQRFNFVQVLKSNGFTEVVMEISYHGQSFRVDPAIFEN